MSRSNNFKIVVNLSHFFNDHRHRARIFVNDRIRTVQDLHDKISNVFLIENFHLSTHNEFLPPSEDVRILQQDEIVWVTPEKPEELITKLSQIANINSKKCKTKRKTDLTADEYTSDELWEPTKRKTPIEEPNQWMNFGENDFECSDGLFYGIPIKKKHKKIAIESPYVANRMFEDRFTTWAEEINGKFTSDRKGTSERKKKHANMTANVVSMDKVKPHGQKISKKKKKHKELQLPESSSIIENESITQHLNQETQRKYKKKKYANVCEQTEMEVDELNLQKKKTTNEHEDIDESFRKTKLVYTKNSALPTITDEYLRENKINIVKIDYVIGKPASSISATEEQDLKEASIQQSENPFESNNKTNKQDEHVEPNENLPHTSGVVIAKKSEIDERKEPSQDSEDISSDEKDTTQSNQSIDAECVEDPKRNYFTPIMPNETIVKKQKYFFNSPRLRGIPKPLPVKKKEILVTLDENGEQIFLPRFFKHPKTYTEAKPPQNIQIEETINLDKDSSSGIIMLSTEGNVGNVPGERQPSPTNVTEDILDSNNIINSSVRNENANSEFSSILYVDESVNVTINDGDGHDSFGISGIDRISPCRPCRSPLSNYQISGVGPILEKIRNTPAPTESNHDSECSEFVTKRKRVRKRSRKPRSKVAEKSPSRPQSLPPVPFGQGLLQGTPAMHIKFGDDGARMNLAVDAQDDAIDRDILNAPPMSNMTPRVGDIIAFKILKLGPSYQPEVSSYIKGRVTDYHMLTQQIAFDIIVGLDQCKEPEGKFSMKDEDHTSIIECRHREYNWSDLLDPRLLYP